MMSTKMIHGERCTFPKPDAADPAPFYKIVGEICTYTVNLEKGVYVNRAGDGFTFYDHERGSAFVSLQPGRLLVDPTVKGGMEGPPPIVAEGLEDGWLSELKNDNYRNSFRAKAPVGPTLTPPQVSAIRASLQALKQKDATRRYS